MLLPRLHTVLRPPSARVLSFPSSCTANSKLAAIARNARYSSRLAQTLLRARPPIPLARLFQPGIARFSRCTVLAATHRQIPNSFRPLHSGGPWRRFTQWLDRWPGVYVFSGIMALNIAVFSGWCYGSIKSAFEGNHKLTIWMFDNFTVSMRSITEGRPWTILTSCFSHKDFNHILFNGLTYYFMAPTVLRMLGNARFLALYLGGGILASTASAYWHARRGHNIPALGASGAISAIIAFYACVRPTATFLVFYVIPCPAWAVVAGLFLFDGYSAYNESRPGVDSAGHVGGLLAGMAYFLRLRLRRF